MIGAAARRFRRGVAGARGFLNSGAEESGLAAGALAVLGFLDDAESGAGSALRFRPFDAALVEVEAAGAGAAEVTMLELGTLVERRSDILVRA